MNARSPKAHTLTEVIVATAISGLVIGGVLAFFIQNLNTYHLTTGKLMVNRDIRKLTTEMSEEARNANFYRIYPSFTVRFDDLNNSGAEDTGEALPAGLTASRSGDFLVLYFLDPTGAVDGTGARVVVRTVGYYRAPITAGAPGPVRKFILTATPTVLPDATTINDYPEVVELSQGLASGCLFLNAGASIVISGEIQHPGSLVRRATNTYNFTISPRG